MHFTFSPIRSEATLSASVAGDVLTVNGVRFDFSQLQNGDRLPASAIASDAIAGDVTRSGDVVHVALTLPHGEDAEEDVRFPAPVTVASGDCTAPGLVTYGGIVTDGAIDWTKRLTPEAAEAIARAEWRATRAVSKLQLMLSLVAAGVVSEASATETGIPAEFEPLVSAMPNPPRAEMRIRWAYLVEVPRLHPLIVAVQTAMGWPDEQVDALFGWGSDD